MTAYEKLYDQFLLTSDKREGLLSLSELLFYTPPKMGRLIVETVIVENGERLIIKKEEQSAKLV